MSTAPAPSPPLTSISNAASSLPSVPDLPVHAVSIASALQVKTLVDCFDGAETQQARRHMAAKYSETERVYCFDFGVVVFVGCSEERQQDLLARLRSKLPEGELIPTFEEDFDIVVDGSLPSFSQVEFASVRVASLTASSCEVIARLVAQSAAVERHEVELDAALAELETLTRRMANTGRIHARHKRVMQLIAKTTATQNRIVGTLSLLDKPDLAWYSEDIDKLHNALHAMLELEDRFKTVEYKLHAVRDTVTMLLEVLQTRRALYLEVTIVVLIAVEIALALLGVA